MFCALNGRNLHARVDDAVDRRLAFAARGGQRGGHGRVDLVRLNPADRW
jgi:hypothetical protein